jgi:hypothetical protein
MTTKVIIAAQTKDLPFVIDVMIADAYALHESLCLAQHFRCTLICLHVIYLCLMKYLHSHLSKAQACAM